MNENLDLTKILDGCPKGTEFYSSVLGKLFLEEINSGSNAEYPMLFKSSDDFSVFLTKDGQLYNTYEDSECILFPSKDQRDWSKFERFWDKPKEDRFDVSTLQPFDKILVRDFSSDNWKADFFESIIENNMHYNVTSIVSHWVQCIPYNEETQHLVGTTDDCPEYYKWWEE